MKTGLPNKWAMVILNIALVDAAMGKRVPIIGKAKLREAANKHMTML